MVEMILMITMLLGLIWWLNPKSATSRRRQRKYSQKAYWEDGHGY